MEYTVSVLEAMPEKKLKEIQNYIQDLSFRDGGNELMEMLTEDDIDLLGVICLISPGLLPSSRATGNSLDLKFFHDSVKVL